MAFTALELLLIFSNYTAFMLGLLLNITVITLCFRIQDEEIEVLRTGIAVGATIELVGCIVLTILHVIVAKVNNVAEVLLLGIVTYFSSTLAVLFFKAFATLLLIRIISSPMVFIYRFAVICEKPRLKSFFTRRNVALLMVSMCIVAGLICVFTFSSCRVYPIVRRVADEIRNADNNADEQTPPPTIYRSIYAVSIVGETTGLVDAFFTFILVAIVLAYTVIGYTSIKVNRMIGGPQAGSARTQALRRQLTRIMVLQAISPTIFTVIPVVMFVALFFAQIHLGYYSSLITALINWQSSVSATITLCFVGPFREHLHKALKAIVGTICGKTAAIKEEAVHAIRSRK